MDRPKLAIITALKEEHSAISAALKGQPVTVVRAGVGCEAAARATRELLSANAPKLICFSGFCGGLNDALAVGDVVLSSTLRSAPLNATYPVDLGFDLQALCAALQAAAIPNHLGTIVTVSQPVFSTEDKRRLGQQHNALAVDMESYAVAQAAGTASKVFALRTVSDSVGDALPPEIGEFLDANGDVRMGRVARFALLPPTNLSVLMGLKARSDKAAKSLAAAWAAIWPLIEKSI